MTRILLEIAKRIKIDAVAVDMPGRRLPQRLRKIAEGSSSRISRMRAALLVLAFAVTCATFAAGVLARARSSAPTSELPAAATHFSSEMPAVPAMQQATVPTHGAVSEYVGSRVSLSVKGVYLADFLRVFAPECGYDVDIEPTVTGVVTFAAADTPCDQTIYQILVKNGLSTRVNGDVLQILATGNPSITLPKPRPHAANPVGGIAGTVEDPTGDALPGAVIELTSPNGASHFLLQMQADAQGAFALDILPPGRYTLSVSQGAFQTYEAPVAVSAGHTSTVDARLKLAAFIAMQTTVDKTWTGVPVGSTSAGAPGPTACTSLVTFPASFLGGRLVLVPSGPSNGLVPPRAIYAPRASYADGGFVAFPGQRSAIVRAAITSDGRVTAECIEDGAGNVTDPGLLQSALRTVSMWKFQPATMNGRPVDVLLRAQVTF